MKTIGNVIVLTTLVVVSTIAVQAIIRNGDKVNATATLTERVRPVHYRTSFQHDGCASNGFLECCGAPRQITAYGISKAMWPHRCTGCGATNNLYDARWPKIEMRWEAVK